MYIPRVPDRRPLRHSQRTEMDHKRLSEEGVPCSAATRSGHIPEPSNTQPHSPNKGVSEQLAASSTPSATYRNARWCCCRWITSVRRGGGLSGLVLDEV